MLVKRYSGPCVTKPVDSSLIWPKCTSMKLRCDGGDPCDTCQKRRVACQPPRKKIKTSQSPASTTASASTGTSTTASASTSTGANATTNANPSGKSGKLHESREHSLTVIRQRAFPVLPNMSGLPNSVRSSFSSMPEPTASWKASTSPSASTVIEASARNIPRTQKSQDLLAHCHVQGPLLKTHPSRWTPRLCT